MTVKLSRFQQIALPLVLSGTFAATTLSSNPSKAATAYLFDRTSCSGLSASQCTTAQREITTSSGDTFWGYFDVPDTSSVASGVEFTGGTYTGASISYTGKPTSGSGYTGSSSGTYTSWAYNASSNTLFFYGGTGSDSLRLTISGGLVQDGGWMQITAADWCSNNSYSGASSTCSNTTTLGSLSSISYIRVPSPSLLLGILPFAMLLASRRRKSSGTTLAMTATSEAIS